MFYWATLVVQLLMPQPRGSCSDTLNIEVIQFCREAGVCSFKVSNSMLIVMAEYSCQMARLSL